MVYVYIRVSSDKQTADNQRFEIERFCQSNGVQVDQWVVETVTGTRHYDKRRLGRVLRRARQGDTIIASEISRLGRNLYMIMDILHQCMTRGLKVWTVKDGFRLGDDIQSKVLAFAFALSAEIERQLISQRTREALQWRKSQGKTLGRPVGALSSPDHYKLAPHRALVLRLHSQGSSIYAIARRLHVSHATVKSFLVREGVL